MSIKKKVALQKLAASSDTPCICVHIQFVYTIGTYKWCKIGSLYLILNIEESLKCFIK